MVSTFFRARTLVLLAASAPAVAQYIATPQPAQNTAVPPGARTESLTVTAKNGQTQEQQWADRYECHRWSKGQSGFDPTQRAPDVPPNEIASRRDQYRRAFVACLEGRGYSVRYGAPPTPPPVVPPSPPAVARQYDSGEPEIRYRPLAVHIDGGYTVAAGDTGKSIDGGANVGFGLTWFPTSMLPIGLRVDGSYSSFRAKDALLDRYGSGSGSDFRSGHENIYGGDADLQLDLAHQSSRSKLYVFGGAGWYREQTHVRQVSFERGTVCDFYFCEQGVFPVGATDRTTSPWRSSWNAGLGWEIAYAEGASFFLEARYLQIGPRDSKLQFVPITVGLRF